MLKRLLGGWTLYVCAFEWYLLWVDISCKFDSFFCSSHLNRHYEKHMPCLHYPPQIRLYLWRLVECAWVYVFANLCTRRDNLSRSHSHTKQRLRSEKNHLAIFRFSSEIHAFVILLLLLLFFLCFHFYWVFALKLFKCTLWQLFKWHCACVYVFVI